MKTTTFVLICAALVIGITLDYLNIVDREIGEPLYRIAISAAIPFLAIILFKKIAFRKWLYFARWWLPLSFILIFLTPVTSNTWMPILALNREGVTLLMGILFTIVSFVLIARAHRN